jgi:hypothetical protein
VGKKRFKERMKKCLKEKKNEGRAKTQKSRTTIPQTLIAL